MKKFCEFTELIQDIQERVKNFILAVNELKSPFEYNLSTQRIIFSGIDSIYLMALIV